MDALHRALVASREVASLAVIVDAKDDSAVAFYRRYEFIPFADQANRLFLPMGTIETAVSRSPRPFFRRCRRFPALSGR